MKRSTITLRLAVLSSAAALLALGAPGHAGAITSPHPITLSQSANVKAGSRITVSSPPGSFPPNPVILPGRTFTDGSTLIGDDTVTSAGQAHFSASDIGRPISGPGIPPGTIIELNLDPNNAFVSNNLTATGSGLTIVLGPVAENGRGLTVVCNQYVFLLAGLGGGRQLEGCDNNKTLVFGSINPDGSLAPTDIITPLGANVDTGGGAHPDPTATCPPPLYQTQLGYGCVVFVIDSTLNGVALGINFAPIYMPIGPLGINPPAGNGGDEVTVLGQGFACGVTTVRPNGTQYCAQGENVKVSVAGGVTMTTAATPDGSFTLPIATPLLGANKAPFKVKITAVGQTSGLIAKIRYIEVG